MATEDDTTVNLTSNNQSGLVIQNYSGQFPIENIKLNRGESYTVALKVIDSDANRDGLIGTLVSADKNIVVNTDQQTVALEMEELEIMELIRLLDLIRSEKNTFLLKEVEMIPMKMYWLLPITTILKLK